MKTSLVRVDMDVLVKIKAVAALRGVSMSKLLTEILPPILDKMEYEICNEKIKKYKKPN